MLGGLIISPIIPSIMGKAALFTVIGLAICQALNLAPLSRAASGVMLTAFLAVAGPKRWFTLLLLVIIRWRWA